MFPGSLLSNTMVDFEVHVFGFISVLFTRTGLENVGDGLTKKIFVYMWVISHPLLGVGSESRIPDS